MVEYHPQKQLRIPHLYQKGKSLYYRVIIPRNAVALPSGKEIRVCLQTCRVKEARRIITLLHAHFLLRISEMEKLSGMDGNSANNFNVLQRLKEELAAKVVEILKGNNKVQLSQAEIKQRLLSRLAAQLEREELEPGERYVITAREPNGDVGEIEEGEIWDQVANNITKQADTWQFSEETINTTILELISEGIIKEEEVSSENLLYLTKMAKIYEGYYYKILAARRSGNYLMEKSIIPSPTISLDSDMEVRGAKKNILYSELVDKYCTSQIEDGNWKSHMVNEHRGMLETFKRVVGDLEIRLINRDLIRSFQALLKQLPPNFTKHKKYKDLSIDKIIAKAETTLSIPRINAIMSALSSCLSWAVREGLLEVNHATHLKLKDNRPAIDKREAFSNDELKLLFQDVKKNENEYKNPAYFWVPIISLYSGMRLEEICQLECQDIRFEDGVWIFDIGDYSNSSTKKKIKNRSSIRQVPIHDQIVKLGFLDYVETIKGHSERIFPQLNATEKSPKYGKQVGKHFSNRVKMAGIKGKKTFHSLRHTFANYFKVNKLDGPIFIQVMGHEQEGIDRQVYGNRFPPKQCYEEVIAKLKYGIEF